MVQMEKGKKEACAFRLPEGPAVQLATVSGVLHTLRLLTYVVSIHYGQLTSPLCFCVSSRRPSHLQLGKSGISTKLVRRAAVAAWS